LGRGGRSTLFKINSLENSLSISIPSSGEEKGAQNPSFSASSHKNRSKSNTKNNLNGIIFTFSLFLSVFAQSKVAFRLKLRQPELLADVEQDVRLALFHLLGGHGTHGAVVEVEPMALVDGESRVVARPGTGQKNNEKLAFFEPIWFAILMQLEGC
jgi:hypothetical protein